MSDNTEDKLTAIVVFTDGGHTFTEDAHRRTPEQIEAISELLKDVTHGDVDAIGFKIAEREVWIRASKIVALTLASGD